MTRNKFLVVLVGSILSINLVTLLIGAFKIFSKPYELMHGEGMTCWTANFIGQGMSLYPEVGSTQLVTNPHPPVYFLVTGGLSSVFGPSLLTGRIVSLLCGLLICGLVFLLVRKLTGNTWVGVISALLVTSLSVFRYLSILYRMDTMGLMFVLAGVYMFVKYEGKGKLIFWSIPFFLLAFFTKQNFITAPIVVCIYLLVKNWRMALKYTGILVGGLVGLLAIGGLLTGGQMLVHNFLYMWYSLVDRGVWTYGIAHSQEILVSYYPIWIAIGLYFGYKIFKRESLSLVDIYFIVVALILVGLTGKGGSAFHYGLETFVVGSVLVGILLAKGFEVAGGRALILRSGLLGAVLLLVVFQSLGFPMGEGYTCHEYMEDAGKSTQEVIKYIRESGKPVLTYLYSAVLLAETGEENDLYDPALLVIGDLVHRNSFGWDQSVVVHRLETGYYGIVMLDFDIKRAYGPAPGPGDYLYTNNWYPRVTNEMAWAIINNYDLVYVSGWMGSPLYPYQSYLFEYRPEEIQSR